MSFQGMWYELAIERKSEKMYMTIRSTRYLPYLQAGCCDMKKEHKSDVL